MRRAAAVLVLLALAWATPAGAQAPPRPGPPSSTVPGQSPAPSGPSSTVPASGSAPTVPGQPTPDPPEVAAITEEAMQVAAEMAAVLDRLGAFSEPLPPQLVAVLDAVEWPEDERVVLLDDLVVLEADGEELLAEVVNAVAPVDPMVSDVLGGPDDATWADLEAGRTGFVDPAAYLEAVEALAHRGGRPALDPNTPEPDGDLLAARVLAAYDDGTPAGPTTVAPSTTVPVEPRPADGREPEGGSSLPWVLAGIVVVAVAGIAAVVALTRRKGGEGDAERFDDLLDVSRRLAAAGDAGEVERIAAAEAARLVDGAAAAVVRREQGQLGIGHETAAGALVPDRLGDGLLGRVVDTGQPVAAVSRDEPSVRQLPVALAAVPVISDGRVQAVLVVVRAPERPFTAGEVDTLRSLGPVVAAALDAGRRMADASNASLTDPLTGVGNRRRLEDELPRLLFDGGPVAVVMVDLDHFKSVNDRFGHPAGDAVLREAAGVLATTVRPGDRVYRYGGEEFAVVLPATGEAEAVAAAERVRAAVAAARVDVGDAEPLAVTASLGVAVGGLDGDRDALSLVARADRALYRAKETGRDRVVAAGDLSV